MAYILGATYVKNYASLLLPYSSSIINVESTNYERTINTAASFLQGVYNGPVTGSAYPSSITAPLHNQATINQIISTLNDPSVSFDTSAPTPTIHVNESILIGGSRSCPKSATWQAQNSNSSDIDNIYNTYMQDVVKYLRSKRIFTGNMDNLYNFGDLAMCNVFAGFPIPGGIDPSSQYYQDVKFAYEWTSANMYLSQDIQVQMSSMTIFQNILSLMDQAAAGKSKLKYAQYSAHDVTLLPMLASLGVVNTQCLLANYVAKKANQDLPYPNCVFPGFTANIAFELYGGKNSLCKDILQWQSGQHLQWQ